VKLFARLHQWRQQLEQSRSPWIPATSMQECLWEYSNITSRHTKVNSYSTARFPYRHLPSTQCNL